MGMRGIEHRNAESVIEAYRYNGKPTFAIFAGREPATSYEGDSMEEGIEHLSGWLDIIANGGTSQIYTLKCYHPGVTNITTKTPVASSTTFMLNESTPVRTENGVTVIDRVAGKENTGMMQFFMKEVEQLRSDNNRLQSQLYQAQLKSLEDKFNTAIAGTGQDVKGIWDRLGETIAENPNVVTDAIAKLKEVFFPSKQPYSSTPEQYFTTEVPMNGTETETEKAVNEMFGKKKDTEPVAAPVELTEEERNALDDRLEIALDQLEEILGLAKLTEVVERFATLDEKQRSMLLNFL